MTVVSGGMLDVVGVWDTFKGIEENQAEQNIYLCSKSNYDKVMNF